MIRQKRAHPAVRRAAAFLGSAPDLSTPENHGNSAPHSPWRVGFSSRLQLILQALDHRPLHFVLVALIATSLAIFVSAHWSAVSYLDDKSLDLYFSVFRGPVDPETVASELPQSKDIVLVETDYFVPRPVQAQILKRLRLAKVVAFDFMFVDRERQLDDEEKAAPWYREARLEWKQDTVELARSIKAHNNVVLGTWPEEEQIPVFRRMWEKPPALLWDSARYHAHLEVIPGIDGVARRVRLFEKTEPNSKSKQTPSLGLAVAAAAMNVSKPQLEAAQIRNGYLHLGNRRIPVGNDGLMTIDFLGGRKSFEQLNNHIVYMRVLDYEPEDFKDKIVIIGESSFKSKEIFETPFGPMPGMQIHANIVSTLLSTQGAPSTLGFWQLASLALLGSAALTVPLLRWPLWLGVPLLAFVAGAIVWIGGVLFAHKHLILPPSTAVLALAFTYTLITLYENRRARETLGRFIGHEMVAPTLNVFSRLKLGGRVEEASALFCDLRGYSALSELLLPEATSKLINEYTSTLVKTVKKHGGRPIDYQGDGVFVLFERTLAGPEYSYRAVQAALELQDDFAALRRKWQSESVVLNETQLDVGIGIETGEMMIGLVGATEHLKPGAIGDAVNIASRVQRLNYECGFPILVTRTTNEHVRGKIDTTACGLFHIKGRETPIEVFGLGAPLENEQRSKKELRESRAD